MSILDFYMVTEAIDYVWLGGEQPKHLHHDSNNCAFEFETPYEKGSSPFFRPAFIHTSNRMVMATMPRKISFYLITGGKTTLCFVFLETIARAKPLDETVCTLHLSSRTGSTVIWQQEPLVRGMYFMYFLFDCFGVYKPLPWDFHAYNSYLEKQENNQKLASDGRWAICTFFRALGALTEFTISGWNEQLEELSKEAIQSPTSERLVLKLHVHLDDLYFHQEKINLHIRLGKVILDDDKSSDVKQQYPSDIRYFLTEYVRCSEYRLQSFDRWEKKIQNKTEFVRVLFCSLLFLKYPREVLR